MNAQNTKMPQEEFDRILREIISEMSPADILSPDLVYLYFAKHRAEEVQQRWDAECGL